jgi:hypothetical protein
MYIRKEDQDDEIPMYGDYKIHEAPKVQTPLEMGRWAYFCLTSITQTNSSYVASFGKDGTDNPNVGNPYEAFVDRMTSYYDNTWAGGSLEYMNKLYGGDQVLPTRFVNYPIMRNKIEWILGRYESAPADLHMSAIDEKSIEERINAQTQKLFLKLLMPFIKELEKMSGADLEPDKTIPEDIEMYASMTFKQIHEINMSNLIVYNFNKMQWGNELSKGMRDTALYGFTFLRIDPHNETDVRVKKPNLRNVIFDWGCENDYGDDAMYFGEKRYMTLSQITTEFQPEKEYMQYIKDELFSLNGTSSDPYTLAMGYTNTVEVVDMIWKASTTKRVKKVPNKYLEGKFIYKILNNDEEPNPKKLKKEGAEIIEIEKYDWYRGVLVGDRVVLKCEPIFAPRKYDELVDTVNPFTAFLFNRINGYKPNGLGELIESGQELFNACMAMLELELATSPGNVVEYDVRYKPKNVPLTDVFYHMKANKLIQVDKTRSNGQGHMFNQVNLGPNAATIYLNVAMYVEQFIDRLTGINAMAQGNIPSDTYVGTLDKAIDQANFITKPIYTFYREGVRKVYKSASCILKEINKGKDRKLSLLMPEIGIKVFQIDGNYPYGEYDFFFRDGFEEEKKRGMLLQLAQLGIQSGVVTFKTVKDLILTTNLNESSAKIDKAFVEFEQKQAQAAQIQQQMEQMKTMAPKELLALKGQIDLLIKQQQGADQKEIANIYARKGLESTIVENELEKPGSTENLL